MPRTRIGTCCILGESTEAPGQWRAFSGTRHTPTLLRPELLHVVWHTRASSASIHGARYHSLVTIPHACPRKPRRRLVLLKIREQNAASLLLASPTRGRSRRQSVLRSPCERLRRPSKGGTKSQGYALCVGGLNDTAGSRKCKRTEAFMAIALLSLASRIRTIPFCSSKYLPVQPYQRKKTRYGPAHDAKKAYPLAHQEKPTRALNARMFALAILHFERNASHEVNVQIFPRCCVVPF